MPKVIDNILHLPRDTLLIKIFNELSDEDRQQLTMVCKDFYGFIHELYYKSIYGRIFAFNRFFDKQLQKLVDNIKHYQASQTISMFNPRRSTQEQVANYALAAIGIYKIFEAILLLFENAGNLEKLFSPLFIYKITWRLIAGLCSMLWVVKAGNIYNENLSGQLLDDYAVEKLRELINNDLFLPIPDVSRLLQSPYTLHYNELNAIFCVTLDVIRASQVEFVSFHKSLIGTNVKQLDLSQLKNKQIISAALDQWNLENDEAKEIPFRI